VTPNALTPQAAGSISSWLRTQAIWVHEDHGFYRNARCTNLRSILGTPGRVGVQESTITELRRLLEATFNLALDPSYASVVAHRLRDGDFIGQHNDKPGDGSETHRVIIHVGCEGVVGGALLLGKGEAQVRIPVENRLMVAFPLSGDSFHEVTAVEAGIRYTVVYSFWEREPLGHDVEPSTDDDPFTVVVQMLVQRGAFLLRHRSKHDDAGRATGSLGNHLLDVARTLARWRVPDHVVVAGLLHSIYGPLGFSQQLVSRTERAAVRTVAGLEAERLAFLFSALERDSVSRVPSSPTLKGTLDDGTEVDLTPTDVHALDQLVWANLVVQARNLDVAAYLRPIKAALLGRTLPAIAKDDIRNQLLHGLQA
jgi:hypothetical protein